jgi:hypothetical protein
VVFVDPQTQMPREIVGGQYAIPIVLEVVIADTKRDVERFRERPQEKVGHIERHRQTVQNAPVAAAQIITKFMRRLGSRTYSQRGSADIARRPIGHGNLTIKQPKTVSVPI